MSSDTTKAVLTINVNIQIGVDSLQAIVMRSKRLAPQTENRRSHVDTAELAAALVSKFLDDKDFDSYVLDDCHYTGLL